MMNVKKEIGLILKIALFLVSLAAFIGGVVAATVAFMLLLKGCPTQSSFNGLIAFTLMSFGIYGLVKSGEL